MEVEINTQFCQSKYLKLVHKGNYGNGRPALALIDPEDGQPYFTVTVNLINEEISEGHVFVKTWSENEGMLQCLTKAGVLQLVDWRPSGYTEAAECKLMVKLEEVKAIVQNVKNPTV